MCGVVWLVVGPKPILYPDHASRAAELTLTAQANVKLTAGYTNTTFIYTYLPTMLKVYLITTHKVLYQIIKHSYRLTATIKEKVNDNATAVSDNNELSSCRSIYIECLFLKLLIASYIKYQ